MNDGADKAQAALEVFDSVLAAQTQSHGVVHVMGVDSEYVGGRYDYTGAMSLGGEFAGVPSRGEF